VRLADPCGLDKQCFLSDSPILPESVNDALPNSEDHC